MRQSLLIAAIAASLAGCAATDPPMPLTALPTPLTSATGDTVVILASDTYFGPSTADAAVAARYYCSTRGKLSQLLTRERPHEMEAPIRPEFSVMTYRCYTPQNAGS